MLNFFVYIILMLVLFFSGRIFDKKIFIKRASLSDLKIPIEKYFVLDSIGFVLGMRKIVSDIAWIQLLQYYGTDYTLLKDENIQEENLIFEKHYKEENVSHEHCEHTSKIQPGRYKKLLKYFQRIIRLDNNFIFAYFYGSGALAWNVERPDEALELISEGLKNLDYQKNDPNSDYWTLVLYQSAIIYKKGGKYKEMISDLESIIKKGQAPNLVKSILANLYKKFGDYDKAIKVWYDILNTADPEYLLRAKMQIYEIMNLKNKR